MWRLVWLAAGLLMLAGVGPRPLAAQESPMADDQNASEPGAASPCAAPQAEPPAQPIVGQSVHHDTSPPLRSITPVPAGPPAALYLVPVRPGQACPPPASAAPAIRTLEPAAGPVGTTVTIRGSGFSPTENGVYFGQGYVPHLDSPDGASIVFVVPSSLDPPCAFAGPPCRPPSIAPPAGTYQLAVVNGNGVSNPASFTLVARAGEP
jgi:IPT/TIG domain